MMLLLQECILKYNIKRIIVRVILVIPESVMVSGDQMNTIQRIKLFRMIEEYRVQ